MTFQKYKAFLSYSHRDKKWADWLHRNLETYKFPKNISPVPDPIKPIFRDREELSVSSNLSKRVQEALQLSDCLIVICSENAAQSKWVNKEILLFRKLKPDAEIFPVIVSGEPHAEKSGLPSEIECFPPALRFLQDNEDPEITIEFEPLAADLRKDKDGKQLGLVKLIAGIANIRPDELIQRNLRRARRRVTTITAASVTIVSVLTLLSISTLLARNAAQRSSVIAEQQRELAETRRDEAEGLIEFMLGDLRRELEPVGRLSILTEVADRALEYYSDTGAEFSHCKSASGAARAKYLHTRIAIGQGDFKTARQYSDEALTLLNDVASNCKHVRQFVVNHTHAMQWRADLDILEHDSTRNKNAVYHPDILIKYTRAKDNLFAYIGADANTADILTDKADAEILIGKYHIGSNQYEAALKHFEMAAAVLDTHTASEEPRPLSRTSEQFIIQDKRADVLTWLSGALEGLSKHDDATAAAQQARGIYVSLNNTKSARGRDWDRKFDIIGTDYALSRLLYKRGKTEAAVATLETLEQDILELVSQDPSNEHWSDLHDNIRSSLAALKPPP